MKTEKQESVFERNIDRGVVARVIEFKDPERKKIIYHAREKKEYRFTDPEELVRASYFVELILDYKYPPPTDRP